jgi:septal ring factor EnvC (AmiA/AmiB activator)
MKWAIAILTAVLFAGCADPAIQVTPQPDLPGVQVQNEETKKQITQTRTHIKKTRQHIVTEQQEAVQEESKLQSVKNDLQELLGRPTTPIATPTPSVTPTP